MDTAVFSTKPYDRRFLAKANEGHGHALRFFEARLDEDTVRLAEGCTAVCAFVNDALTGTTVAMLAKLGVRTIALRCAGYNQVDLAACKAAGLRILRVPAYSPQAVAEHTIALILTLDRNIHRAYNRIREGNFAPEGLLGFDLGRRTVGLIGTGRIGEATARILTGFGCRLLVSDPVPNPKVLALGAQAVSVETLLRESDIVSLHVPLLPTTRHLINAESLARMKRGAMLINTSRGALIDTGAVIGALKRGQLGSLGLDVYEEEADLFFEDHSGGVIQDDTFARLLTFPNVVITGHQAFFTEEALTAISETTIANLSAAERGLPSANEVLAG